MVLPSYVLGPFYLILGFILCLIIVVGIKSIFIFIKDKIKSKFFNKSSEKVKEFPKEKNPKPQKSVYLNTEDIDRIYFKKSS